MASVAILGLFFLGTLGFWSLLFYALTRPESRPGETPPPPPAWVGTMSVLAPLLLAVAVVGIFLVLTAAVGALVKAAADDAGVTEAGVATGPRGGALSALRAFGVSGAFGSLLLTAIVTTVSTGVGAALLILPGLAALVMLSLSVPAVVLEGLRPVAALRRSLALVRANPWLVARTVAAVGGAGLLGWFVVGATGPLVLVLAPVLGAVLISWGSAALTLVFLACKGLEHPEPQTGEGN